MINLEILNQNEEVDYKINLNQVVSKPLEKLQYSKFIDDRSIVLDYFESVEINSEDHLEINDLSWKAAQNNVLFFNDIAEGKTENTIIRSFYRDLHLTNTVLRNSKENIEIPVWYKHKRKNIKEINFHILSKGSLLEIEEGFVLKNGCAYTNYKNDFDNKSSDYRIYFVSGVTENGEAFNELLNVEDAIKRTTYEDISLEDGSVINDSYEVNDGAGGIYEYRINYVDNICENETTSKFIYFKAKDSNYIKLLKPESYTMQNPWFARITNGHFVRKGMRYWVPEFINQPFDGQFGTIRLINKDCTYVTESLVKLPVDKILIDPQELINVDLHVLDESDNIVHAITTDVSKIDKKYSNSDIRYKYGIASWDEEYGFLELDLSLDVSHKIKCNFYYRADCCLDRSLNLNFYSNELLIHNKVLFYLIPNQTQKSIYYLVFDEEDRILESSNPKFKSINSDGSFNLSSYIGKSLSDFREERCIGQDNPFQYLELGEVSFKEDYYLDEAIKLNIKNKGYLKESNILDYYNRQHKGLQSKFGYGEEGQTVQKNNLIYIKYPIDLLETFGGSYKEKELIRYSKRKLQPGVSLVVDYDYPKVNLSFKIDPNRIEINMSWEGPGIYKLYRSLNEFSEEFDEDQNVIVLYEKESLNKESLMFVDETAESDTVYWYSVRVDNYPKGNKYSVRSK